MTLKRASWLLLALLAVALLAGCSTDNEKDPLQPPHLSRDPQVRVTHAPTEMVASPGMTEAVATLTVQPADVAQQPFAGPTEDEEQALMDEIEALLNKVERKLDQTDTNP